jgi:hypothetical protein
MSKIALEERGVPKIRAPLVSPRSTTYSKIAQQTHGVLPDFFNNPVENFKISNFFM